jgi:hypothetical protein
VQVASGHSNSQWQSTNYDQPHDTVNIQSGINLYSNSSNASKSSLSSAATQNSLYTNTPAQNSVRSVTSILQQLISLYKQLLSHYK